MVAGDFRPQAKLSQHLKDVRLILEAGAEAGAKLPFSDVHAKLLAAVQASGNGDLDNSAIIQAFASNCPEKELAGKETLAS
jgi:3-hydroxyisobutyrate dehydrogenase-like beta-hydroxyacid dehydrogenase